MAIVNFSVPAPLEKRVKRIVKEKGFGSKAEFFRFAAIHFIDIVSKPAVSEDERFDYLTKAISEEVRAQYTGKSIPPLRDQLANL